MYKRQLHNEKASRAVNEIVARHRGVRQRLTIVTLLPSVLVVSEPMSSASG
jgi:hypothetical protein